MRIMAWAALSMVAALSLAACASIPIKTVYNLWNFDPWTSEFRTWRAAVRLPEGRGVAIDRARIQMKVETWVQGAANSQIETFVLERSVAAADLAPLAAERRAGFALGVYRFAPADYPRMEALRARILAAKQNGTHKKGALTILPTSCDGAPGADGGAFPISTYLMVDAKDGYNPLVVDYDLGPDLRAAAKGAPSPICAKGG